MSQNAAPPPAPLGWQANNIRLIAFPAQSQYGVAQNWWNTLTGAGPESILDRPQRHEREESGAFQSHDLSLTIDLLRIQWTASPRVDAENINLADHPPVLGPFIERQEWFRGLMEQWLPQCPPINRLAFTASLLQPVANHQSGYELLDRYLRWVDVDPQSSEFLYRINRRANSAVVKGISINRISTWVMTKFTVFVQALGGGGPAQGEELMRGERFACAVELDINTAPEFQGPLPHANLLALFDELMAAGIQIATNGDARP